MADHTPDVSARQFLTRHALEAEVKYLHAKVERLRAESDGRLTTWNDCRERLWAAEAERDQLRQLYQLSELQHDRGVTIKSVTPCEDGEFIIIYTTLRRD